MAKEQPQTKRNYMTDLPAWLIVLIIAAGVAGHFLNAFLRDRTNTTMTAESDRPTRYVVRCVVGSTGAPKFGVASPGNKPNAFTSTSRPNQLLLGEMRDGQEVILLTVETKPGGANGCGVLIITGEQDAVVEWASDLDHDHDSPTTRRRDTRVHTTGTTEWDVPCRVRND